MLNISGYDINEQIYQGTRTVVYRGKRGTDTPVVIKAPLNAFPTPAELAGIRAEFDIGRSIEHQGVVRPLALERADHRLALVLEDFGGQPLARTINARPMELAQFFQLATPLVEALAELHRGGITHKDINPTNIIHNPQTNVVKISDLSIASVLRREGLRRGPQLPLLGTLRYMSPEQTGRVNRTIDYRTDYYSLGATFYEMLTGQPPFPTEDPVELLHCHLAHTPAAPSALDSRVPAALSRVVLKLLAKAPDDRYQSGNGLLADLRRCAELHRSGATEGFVPGTDDRSARFQIPERLYGRQREQDRLRAALDRAVDGSRQLLLLEGESGIGKSALVHDLLGPVTRRRGWFVKGRHDRVHGALPHTALIQAAAELVQLLLTESDQKLSDWRRRLGRALGDELQVLTAVLPGLEQITGSAPAAPKLPPDEAESRFHRLFRELLRELTASRTLVIYLKDLQWADSSSLSLMESLLADDKVHHLLLLGGLRDTDPGPLTMALGRMEQGPAEVQRIRLAPLDTGSIAQLIADTTHSTQNEAHELAELVRNKTLGNPFFVGQLLNTLHTRKLLSFDVGSGRWRWDLVQIKQQRLADDVVELLIQKMVALPGDTMRVLELAACIGNRFDLGTLSIISEMPLPDVARALLPAVEAGIITTVCGGFNHLVRWDSCDTDQPSMEQLPEMMQQVRCDFHHEQLHRAAHSHLARGQHDEIHLRLGRRLIQRLDGEALQQRLLEVVNHFNEGRQLLTVRLECLEVARLNLQAAERARQSGVRDSAEHYFDAGIRLLPEDHWESSHELSFALHLGLYSCRVIRPDRIAETVALGEELVAHASTTTERLEAVSLHVMQLTIRARDPERALLLGTEALRLVQIEIDTPDPAQLIARKHAELWDCVGHGSLDKLLELPSVTDPEILATMKLLNNLFFSPMYIKYRDRAPLVALASVQLSLQHGNGPGSGAAYATWAIVMAHTFGDYREGYRLGRLAVAVADRQGSDRALVRAIASATTWLGETPAQSVQRIREGHSLALETGETFAAAIFAGITAGVGLMAGLPLESLYQECKQLSVMIEQEMGTQIGPREIHLTLRYIEALRGQRGHDELFDSPAEAAEAQKIMAQRNLEALQGYHLQLSQLGSFFGDHQAALEHANELRRMADQRVGHPTAYLVHFNQALALAGAHDSADPQQQAKMRAQIHENIDQLSRWVEAGMGGQLGHLLTLVVAELARLEGKVEQATQAYRQAIVRASELDLPQFQALSNELAGRFYAAQGLTKVALVFLKDAHYCYEKWGATAKAEQLADAFPELQLQVTPQPASYTSTGTTTTSGEYAFDISTVIKASMAISGEVKLEALLQRLLGTIMENAGAHRGFLTLVSDGEARVEAACLEPGKLQQIEPSPLAGNDQLPAGVVQYVMRTRQHVVLADAAARGLFRSDPHISSHGVRSVLCTPLIKGGQLLGAIYLDNNLAAGAFTDQRLELVNLLCGQAAIAIDNARLYGQLEQSNQQLEQKVAERTRDLAHKNQQLEQSLQVQQEMQNQLLIAEKMASLGNLVAGVAHEINTPVGALVSSTDTSRRAIEKLQKQLHRATSLEEVQQGRKVERLFTLLWSNFEVMGTASKRVTRIINTLRNFARLDEAERKQVDLHEGLDSTLTLVGHRLKDRVTVVKQYGELRPTLCYPNQLNQVFMNLLVNAVDALEESGQGGTITIRTWIEDDQARIRIRDDGPGIPAQKLPRIFDPGFTTKGVGVGTGLGLSICFNIIQKHSGTLTVDSAPGQGSAFTITLPLE